jgi:hypothetical protein
MRLVPGLSPAADSMPFTQTGQSLCENLLPIQPPPAVGRLHECPALEPAMHTILQTSGFVRFEQEPAQKPFVPLRSDIDAMVFIASQHPLLRLGQ